MGEYEIRSLTNRTSELHEDLSEDQKSTSRTQRVDISNPFVEPLRTQISLTKNVMQSFNVRIHEYRVKELTKDASKIPLSFERYLNELISFTIYSGYPQIKKAVIRRAKIKKKLRDARK